MAHCVVSAIMDTDEDPPAVVAACVVHTHWAPCPHDGEPACTIALHCLPGTSRSDALRMWRIRTHKQRPLVIHRVDGRDVLDHETGDDASCPCGPEVIPAEVETSAPREGTP